MGTARRRRHLGVVLAIAVLVAGCSTTKDDGGPKRRSAPASTTGRTRAHRSELLPVRAEGGEHPRFVDSAGRQVLLRGVNVNSLGDYDRADPDQPPTLPVTDADWRSMASLGFDVVRLVVSWSHLEPTPGELDRGYVRRIHDAVRRAAAHGLYVVIDMHQDAWGRYIATPADHQCPSGLERAVGWDGAPAWATLTDGAETCRAPGNRESAAAVHAAFQSFYDDRAPSGSSVGIRTALARTWGRLAAELAADPAVVGYDLFNEPNGVGALDVELPKYTAFVDDAIVEIRAAEQRAGGFHHVVFVEPIVLFPLPNTMAPPGFSTDPNLAFSPHQYWGSITDLLTVEQGFRVSQTTSSALGMPYWVGEYGWWSTNAQDLGELRRYAAAEDAAVVGGAWWQWRQACGDPHSIGVPGNRPSDQIHLNGIGCPGDRDLGITRSFAVVLARSYPRAAPGRVTELVSDPEARTATIAAEAAESGGQLVVWVPDGGRGEPHVVGSGLTDVRLAAVRGGWNLTARVTCARYRLTIDAPPTPSSTTHPTDAC